jgi:hypothetical protein
MTAPVALNAVSIYMGFSAEASERVGDVVVDRDNLIIGSLQYVNNNGIKLLCELLCKQGRIIDAPEPAGGRGKSH